MELKSKLAKPRAELKEAWDVALATIAGQKTRAFLTTLGVVIGVGSVIIVAAIIDRAEPPHRRTAHQKTS